MNDYFNLILLLLFIQIIVFFSWSYFLFYTIKLLRETPKLQFLNNANIKMPEVSVILPARNEEKYIGKCLNTLTKQDYLNYEIIAINDSSTDKTGEIIQEYSKINPKVILINAEPKPEGWTGKNWACHQRYLKSTGSILLFTDADTTHDIATISVAVDYLLKENLDALTAAPKILACDFWTKVTLPILWTLSLARYSALKANDPKTKVGYFFGSFFIIKRETYEAIGTHRSVKEEIVEDGELGRKTKEQGFRLMVVNGVSHVNAVWARDSYSLWHGLRRLMIPLYEQERIKAILMVISSFLLLLFPLIVLPFSILVVFEEKDTISIVGDFSSGVVLLLSFMSMLFFVITNTLHLKYTVFQNPLYSLAFPLSGSLVFMAFLSSIIQAHKKDVINWRGRRYSIKENKKSSK